MALLATHSHREPVFVVSTTLDWWLYLTSYKVMSPYPTPLHTAPSLSMSVSLSCWRFMRFKSDSPVLPPANGILVSVYFSLHSFLLLTCVSVFSMK